MFREKRRGSQVVRQRSAKPLFGGSIPPRASKIVLSPTLVGPLPQKRSVQVFALWDPVNPASYSTLHRTLLVGLIFFSAHASAQLLLKIDQTSPVSIGAEALNRFPRHSSVLNDHGRENRFEGVLLNDLLLANGVDLSKPLRGTRLAIYVAAIGSDGYEVVYGLADPNTKVTVFAERATAGVLSNTRRSGRCSRQKSRSAPDRVCRRSQCSPCNRANREGSHPAASSARC